MLIPWRVVDELIISSTQSKVTALEVCVEVLLDQPWDEVSVLIKLEGANKKKQKEAIGWRLIKHTGSLHKNAFLCFYALFHLFCHT